jgi:molybdopterin-containing oxidoreductase family iron-sulfur binding subunit
MTKQQWTSVEQLGRPAEPRTTDEFSPAVARAIAELRAAGGHSNVSCEAEGNTPAALDKLREQLRETMPGLSRRGFLQLSGAAAVFALAACQDKHPDTIVPYAQQPDGQTIGNAMHYSSTIRDSGTPVAVVVKTYDGRPIKIEGNPDSPLTKGRADARTQAALLNLYDPDRLRYGPIKKDGSKLSWADFDAAFAAALKSAGANGVVLLTGPIDSPSQKTLISELVEASGGKLRHAVFNAYPRLAESEARRQAFGDPTLPHFALDKAGALVAFGDLLGDGCLGDHVAFGDFRRLRGSGKDSDCGQVIVFEPVLSQLGSCADLRVRANNADLAIVAWAIAEAVAAGANATLPAAAKSLLDSVRAGKSLDVALGLNPVPGASADTASPIAYAAAQLLALKTAGKSSLVYAGGASRQGADSVGLHLAVAFLNSVLGNEGVTVVTPPADHAALSEDASTANVLADCAAGTVSTAIVWGCNPANASPAAAAALAKVATVVVIGQYLDETAALATMVAPSLHDLENWGDAEVFPGVYSIQQPTLPPLWDSRAGEESLLAGAVGAGWITGPLPTKADPNWVSVVNRTVLWQAGAAGVPSWRDRVRAQWTGALRTADGAVADERAFWNAALLKGVLTLPVPVAAPTLRADGMTGIPAARSAPAAGYALVVTAARTMTDGSGLNNAWLQELPDPVSKVTWDGYLAISATDAAKNGLSTNDVVKLSAGSFSGELALHIQEGQTPGTLELFAGWGRTHAGAVAALTPADGGCAVNAFGLLTAARTFPSALAATIDKTGRTYQLANVQGHDFVEGRDIAREETIAERRAAKREASEAVWAMGTDRKPGGDLSAQRSSHVFAGHKWGMAVDLNTCTGCNACVVACSAENNVPAVGRDQVRLGRRMHWIRIDRYYSGRAITPPANGVITEKSADSLLDVEVVHQPIMCQQCDNAPCEAVCPANATMHNQEGISLQIYNRCVGTRYCANNCPYKVRRFNWYEYSAYRAGPVGSGKPMSRIVKNLITDHATSGNDEMAHAPLQLLLNPEVTVRSRGVMEKCNFCVQRTRQIRDAEHGSNQRLADGTITTACAQTCPTKSLVFGDISDPQSEVSLLAAATGGYRLLDAELNTRPAVTYQPRVRNRPDDAAAKDKA